MIRRIVLPVMCLSLIATGVSCGSSDDDDAAGDTTTSMSAPPGQNVEADKAAGQNAVLKLSHRPAGWTAESDDDDDDDAGKKVTEAIADCLDVPVESIPTDEGPTGIDSPTF